MTEVLSADELSTVLASRPGWAGTTDAIERTVDAADFMTGIRIVDEVAEAAEAADHHPDIDIRWRRVRFALASHDAGGVATRDVDLAARIDAIAAAHGAT
jgi:4a-hydroxytetrahydrobiopterin dehydratase